MDTTIKYPSHNDLVHWYYQLAQNIAESAGVTPEQVNDLIEAYIAEHPYPVVPDDIITQANAAANVVTSVNGEKGDVTVTGGGDVPENVITTENIAQNAVTSFNGAKGDVTGVTSVNGQTGAVTVEEVPSNVITGDNIAVNAVTSFNTQKGDVTYTPPVTSVNGLTGNLYTVITKTSGTITAYATRMNSSRAIIFVTLPFEFEGIDVSYNCAIPQDLGIQPVYVYSWLPQVHIYGSPIGCSVNYQNRTIKIFLDHTDVVSPVQSITAGCVIYGTF